MKNFCTCCGRFDDCSMRLSLSETEKRGCSKFISIEDYNELTQQIVKKIIGDLRAHIEIERAWDNLAQAESLETSIKQLETKYLNKTTEPKPQLIATCAGCGKTNVEGFVASSAFGAFAEAFCLDCLATGRDSYSAMCSYISCAGPWPDGINETYRAFVLEQLKLHNKTELEFVEDLKKFDAIDFF